MTDQKKVIEESPSSGRLVSFARSGPLREPQYDQDIHIVDWVDRNLKLPFWKFFLKTQKYNCGHSGVRKFSLRIYGRDVRPSEKMHDELCPTCALKKLQSEIARCCLCARAIMPGEVVSLYNLSSVEPKDFPFNIINENRVIGCGFSDCAESSFFYVGHWNGVDITPIDFSRGLR